MPALRLACLAYLSLALPGSTVGLLWPSMRLSFDEPVGALGLLLAFGIAASVIASAATGRILSRVRAGPLVALGTLLSALAGSRKPPSAAVVAALAFTAVEAGVESGAGIWGYIFLTAGRGLSHQAAGVAVAAYWATMFAGRVVLGPVAERTGPLRLLACAVVGVPLGAALMTVPGPAILAVIGMMTLGLAAAPVFPLFTLTTAHRMGTADVAGTSRTVSLQVAASAVGGTALPAVLGLAIGAAAASILAPLLLVLGLAMCGVYGIAARLTGRPPG